MNGDESPKHPDQAVLRTQLTELNVRSRWYVAQLWQVPLAFVAATAIPLAQLATKENGGVTLTLGLIGASMVGFSVFFHLLGVRADAKRAVEDLKEIEKELGLTVTAEWTRCDYIPFFLLVGGLTLAYLLAGLWLLCPLAKP